MYKGMAGGGGPAAPDSGYKAPAQWRRTSAGSYIAQREAAGMSKGMGGRDGGKRDALGEYRVALYEKRQGYEGMVRTACAMVRELGARINALALRSDDLPGALRYWTPRRYELAVGRRGGKTVLGIKRRGARRAARAAGLRIAVAEVPGSPGLHCAVSDCGSAEFAGIFSAFISRYTPEISRLFLTNGDMAGVLGSIESQGYDVRVEYGSARGRGRGARRAASPPAAFFAGLDGEARAALTVGFAAAPRGSGGGAGWRGTVARDCRFSATSSAEVLFKTAIPAALSLPLGRNRLMEASARSAGSGAVEPVVVRFGGSVLGDEGKNRRCADMIARMPDSSISTYHVGSHMHLSLVDYMDGSSYDVWAVTSDRLAIMPQIRASGVSVKRLVNHIFEHMGEGRLERYEH